MTKLPDAIPQPEPIVSILDSGNLCISAPVNLVEACFSVPGVRALKHAFPEGKLTILCEDDRSAIWEVMPEVDQVITFPEKSSYRQIAKKIEVTGETFDAVIVWGAAEAAKAMVSLGVPKRLGYPAKELLKCLTQEISVQKKPAPIEHRVRYYLDFLKELGIDAYKRKNFAPSALESTPKTLCIGVAPASMMGASYEWPLERFTQVVEAMNARHNDIEWVVLGDKGNAVSKTRCEEFVDSLGDAKVHDTTEWSARSVLDELTRCSALLACDSYTAHLAAHVGLPAAVIFGPNEPHWRRPLGKQSLVIREHVACSPCYLSRCPLDMRCQNEISVKQVTEELEKALSLRVS